MLERLDQLQEWIIQTGATYHGLMFLAGMLIAIGGTIIVAVTQNPFPLGFFVLGGGGLALYGAWKGSDR